MRSDIVTSKANWRDGEFVWDGPEPTDAAERRRLIDDAIAEAYREAYADPEYVAEEERLMKEFESADREAWLMLDEEDGGYPMSPEDIPA